MKQLMKDAIKRTPLYSPLRNWLSVRRQKRELIEWERHGRSFPIPHIVKQHTVRSFAERFGLKVLIETGTYHGDMVEAMKGHFSQIYSIELSKELYEKANKRFAGEKKIKLIHGDSGIELGKLIGRLDQPALFWLDGHYSAGETAKGDKDTPIYEELTHIFNTPHGGHVIIIDDARYFGKDPAYPSIEALSNFIRTKRPDASIEIEDDSIRITPEDVNPMINNCTLNCKLPVKRTQEATILGKFMKTILAKPHQVFTNFFFDPWDMLKRWRGIFYFIRNAITYTQRNTSKAFHIFFRDLYYRSYDRYASAGSVPMHYFLQDIWAARYVHDHHLTHVIDIGSRLDGYIAHLLTFCRVTYIDIRPLDVLVENLEFVGGNITSLPFPDCSISCLSSLHVIEHIGLGRYGDPVDPEGYIKAAREMQRVLASGGTLILSTVLGQEKLCFDAHRIFSPKTIRAMFSSLTLETFCLIDDKGNQVLEDATFEAVNGCTYSCGIFVFKKSAT